MKILLPGVVAAGVLAIAPVLAQEPGNGVRGLVYAETNCSQCHEVRRGRFESPDFEAPAFQDIANAEGMSEFALYAFLRTSHPSMPNFVIPPERIADLTAYLLNIRKKP